MNTHNYYIKLSVFKIFISSENALQEYDNIQKINLKLGPGEYNKYMVNYYHRPYDTLHSQYDREYHNEHVLVSDFILDMAPPTLGGTVRSVDELIEKLKRDVTYKSLFKVLNLLHSHNIYHRDIKPGNTMITQGSTEMRRLHNPKFILIDFGCVTDFDKLTDADYNPNIGTQNYLSPFIHKISGLGDDLEQFGSILRANDFWAMALTYVKYITGQEWTSLVCLLYTSDAADD